jgi:hypothetical protein
LRYVGNNHDNKAIDELIKHVVESRHDTADNKEDGAADQRQIRNEHAEALNFDLERTFANLLIGGECSDTSDYLQKAVDICRN